MTAVQNVVGALVTLAKTALPGIQVLDGWNGKTALDGKMLFVAFAPAIGSPTVTSTVDEDEGGLCDVVETITVACTAAAWDGEMEFTAKRGELASMLTGLRAAIAADIKLGGIAFDAWLAPTAQWFEEIQQSTNDSAARATVQVDFSITVRVHAP